MRWLNLSTEVWDTMWRLISALKVKVFDKTSSALLDTWTTVCSLLPLSSSLSLPFFHFWLGILCWCLLLHMLWLGNDMCVCICSKVCLDVCLPYVFVCGKWAILFQFAPTDTHLWMYPGLPEMMEPKVMLREGALSFLEGLLQVDTFELEFWLVGYRVSYCVQDSPAVGIWIGKTRRMCQ